ncbi:MAG: S8 family peptidase [Bacteroidia bacterium]
MKKNTFILLVLFWFVSSAFAQEGYYRYWVTFKDKDSSFSVSRPQEFLSAKAIARREKFKIPVTASDLPVNKSYVAAVSAKGFKILHTSRWLNAITVQTVRKSFVDSLSVLPFVSSVKFIGLMKFTDEENSPDEPVEINEALSKLESKFSDGKKKIADTNYLGKSTVQMNMMNLPKLYKQGFYGKGITIAIFDAGFKNASKLDVFRFAFDSNHVKGTRDFVEANNNVFDDDDHGISVWSCMAAKKPFELIGTSPEADYWLLRTEYAPTESLIEETHWLAAAEFADSAGVDIISSSVGYNEFDDKSLNHVFKDLDGKTTIISKAASTAASKGIMIINSAGNEGDNDWKNIVAPADVQTILTVGSVDAKGKYSTFSSIGPTADKRIKPDVVTLGEDVWVPSVSGTYFQTKGTSYACPIVSGMIACLMQANPLKQNTEIISAIKLSSSNYFSPDKFIGSGIPDAGLANKMLGGDPDFPLSKDIVIDARILGDSKLYLTFYSRTAQKISFKMEDMRIESGFLFLAGTMDCKTPGITRVAVSSKKIPKGNYAIYVKSKDGVSSCILKVTE